MVGKQIHAARKSSGITLDNLAEKVGISKGHLSQIERDQADPSLTALRKISEELNIPINELFVETPQREAVFIPRKKRTRIIFGDSNITFELITANRPLYAKDISFDVIAYNALPRAKIPTDLAARNCEELVYVVSGQVEYAVADEMISLHAGDSIFVPNNTGYSLYNSGMDVAELILVLAPRQEGIAAAPAARPIHPVPQGDLSWNVAGEKIRVLRQKKGLKINDFAALLGISATHISRMERDLIEPSLSVLRKIASVLDVTIPDLLSGSFSSDIVVTTPETRKKFQFSDQEGRVSHCFCTPNALNDGTRPTMSVYLSELEAKQMDNRQYALHEKSDEVMVLLEGNLEVIMEDSAHTMSRGDGVFIPRGIQHRLYNPGESKVQVVGILVQ